MKIASVIVNYNEVEFIRRLLESGNLAGTDVFVVDNGQQPREVTATCASLRATAVLLPSNIGFAGAINAAVARLPSEYTHVLLVNPDLTLTPDAVPKLARAIEELNADAVCPLILNEDSDAVQGGNGGGPLTIVSLATYYWCFAHVFPFLKGVYLTRFQLRRLTQRCQLDWLCMAFLLVQRDAFDRYGSIPDNEILYSEDVAWGTHASSLGARLYLVPDVTVRHKRGGSGTSSFEAYYGTLTRLLHRRLTPMKARVAHFIVWSGLMLRRAFGRRIG